MKMLYGDMYSHRLQLLLHQSSLSAAICVYSVGLVLSRHFFPYMLISNQAHSTEGRSKRYTCSRELLNTLEKGSSFHPARPMKKARASPAMFLRATDDEKVVLRAPQYKGTVTQERR
jgi:hypothetical protein